MSFFADRPRQCYKLQFHDYQRHFRQPLHTSHGIWEKREGIILSLTDEEGRVGWGEIAPIPWFGSETLAMAYSFCQRLGGKVTTEAIANIPDSLPACQFAFESALEDLFNLDQDKNLDKFGYSYLLARGEDALKAIPQKKGTFKWKIGLASLEEEIGLFQRLIQLLPSQSKLRLDANGGLNWEEAQQWLKIADESGVVEFLEQPLSPDNFAAMLDLSQGYSTSLALDESVATLQDLENCYHRGWSGIFVIKAAIAGSPKKLRHFCQQHSLDAIFSSAFETKIGRKAALRLAAELSNPERALGFGVNHWF